MFSRSDLLAVVLLIVSAIPSSAQRIRQPVGFGRHMVPAPPTAVPVIQESPGGSWWDSAVTGAAIGAVGGWAAGWLLKRNAGRGCDDCPRPSSYPVVFAITGGFIGFVIGAVVGDGGSTALEFRAAALWETQRRGVLPNSVCSRRRSCGTRRGTRFARVHGAILLDPPQLKLVR
jgi:hypothetical protein